MWKGLTHYLLGLSGMNEKTANDLIQIFTSIDTDGSGTINYTGNNLFIENKI